LQFGRQTPELTKSASFFGVLRLLGVLQGPSQTLRGLPALLSPNGLALGMNELHVLRWTGAEISKPSGGDRCPRCPRCPVLMTYLTYLTYLTCRGGEALEIVSSSPAAPRLSPSCPSCLTSDIGLGMLEMRTKMIKHLALKMECKGR